MNPLEDDTSSTALRPAVPTTEGSLAEAAGAPVSSNIPLPAAGLPMPDCLQALASQGEADRRALMQDFETRFASRLLSLETMLAERTSTADDVVADLAARVSVIEAQSSRQQRVSTSVEQNVPINVQRFVRLARPTDVPSALAVALEAEIQERSQAAEDPYRRPTYTDVPSGARNSPARHCEPSAMLRCYHCNDVGHFARNCPGMSESLSNSAARAKFPSGNYYAGRRGQDPA
ncbi:hypothetical protein MTO96_034758 [Rhipicephalus appendiculatus]